MNILSNFIEKTFRIYQITEYNASLWKILQSENYKPRHIMVYDIKTVVAISFGYIFCTTMKTCLWLTI